MADGNRSFTDAITNAALFARVDTIEYLRWLGARDRQVNDALPQFLHEFTHHWCFDSIVGGAIAMVRLRAQRHTMVDGEPDGALILGDVVRSRTAEIVLRPFSEGLALFAEFDIVPSHGPVVSRTTSAAFLCFGVPVGDGDLGQRSAAELSLAILMQGMRRRPEFLRRKTGIHAMPYEYEDGYLSGYLSVKSLWAALAARAAPLNDKDTFLAFLRSWIYDDPGLARVIVAEDRADPSRPMQAIAQRVHDRFARLFLAPDFAAIVDRWCAAVEAGEPVLHALGSSPDEFAAVQAEILALAHDDVQRGGTLARFAAHALETLARRRYVVLGGLRSVVTCGAGTFHVAAADATFAQGDLPMPDGEFEGELCLLLPSRLDCLLMCLVATDGEVYLLRSYGDTGELEPQEITGYLLNRENEAALQEIVGGALGQLEPVRAATAVCDRNAARLCDQIYARLATLHTREPDIGGVLALLRQKGLLSVVDGEHATVRALAAIGLANTSGADGASLMLFEKMLGLKAGSMDAAIATATERHGMRLLQRVEKYGGAVALV
jgi:hypothetical protein